MENVKNFWKTKIPRIKGFRENGVALIIVILVLAFLLSVGIALITVVGAGSKVAGNIRNQGQAFNAAEAGFDAAWIAVEDFFADEVWTSFDGHYLKEPTGIDIPYDQNYFRKLTDLEILNLLDQNGDGFPDYDNVIFFKQPFIRTSEGTLDSRFTYTAFLIDDEAGAGLSDPGDVLLICIGTVGRGSDIITSRLEIGLAVELESIK
ncbi:MAG: pilus assembly PilX N-terminal domain-containing protein [Candidatus Aminicenantes bacterium]|nr:pilus assembly PilX N-terminal domain-containing protein [Candidatus Aminicenantes bacterium]